MTSNAQMRQIELDMQPHGYRAFGATEDITDCWHCGKTGLKKTVKMRFLDADGNEYGETYIGTTCAAKLLCGGKANAKLATKIMREAEAANYRKAEAVKFSRQMLAFFEAAGPTMNEKLDAYVTANRALQSLPLLEQLKATAASIARHGEVVATNGESALNFA